MMLFCRGFALGCFLLLCGCAHCCTHDTPLGDLSDYAKAGAVQRCLEALKGAQVGVMRSADRALKPNEYKLMGKYVQVNLDDYRKFAAARALCRRTEAMIGVALADADSKEVLLNFSQRTFETLSRQYGVPGALVSMQMVEESRATVAQRVSDCICAREESREFGRNLEVYRERQREVVREILKDNFQEDPAWCPGRVASVLQGCGQELFNAFSDDVKLNAPGLVEAFCQGFFLAIKDDVRGLVIEEVERVLTDEVYAELSNSLYKARFVVSSALVGLFCFVVKRDGLNFDCLTQQTIAALQALKKDDRFVRKFPVGSAARRAALAGERCLLKTVEIMRRDCDLDVNELCEEALEGDSTIAECAA